MHNPASLPYLKTQKLPSLVLAEGKKVLFLSDLHLGTPTPELSTIREEKFCQFIRSQIKDLGALVFLGDIFDCWVELPSLMHQDFPIIMGLFAELKEQNFPVYFFTGNHEIFMRKYIWEEFGINVIRGEAVWHINNKQFYLAHGHGLGPQEKWYRLFKLLIESDTIKMAYDFLPADFGLFLAKKFAETRGLTDQFKTLVNHEPNEALYSLVQILDEHPNLQSDYYLFGHVHQPEWKTVSEQRHYINLGEWIHYYSYSEFDGEKLHLRQLGSCVGYSF